MAKFYGNSLVVTFNSGGWSANFVRSAEVTATSDVVDSTGAGDADKTYLATIGDATGRVEFIADSSNTTIAAVCARGTSSTLAIYPNGNTSGHQKISGTAIVTSIDSQTTYNGLALMTVAFQFNGGAAFTNA